MFEGRFSKFCAVLLVSGILFSACPISYATTNESNSIQQVHAKNENAEQELVSKDNDNTSDDINLLAKPARDYTPEIKLAGTMVALAGIGVAMFYATETWLKSYCCCCCD